MSKVKFDGEAGSPELERITAKKNYASSMQSHKMGATLIFNMIHQYLSAEKYPALRNGASGNVAVKQLPILAFLKTLVEGTTDQYHHKYIGNFTVGADKGDKGWFGFDGDGIKARIVRLEGTDHLKGAGFNYPWMVGDVETMQYSAKHEAICVVKGNSEEDWTKVLEVSQCGDKKGVEEISAYLKEKIKPIYECAYHANPLIAGTTATLEEMNADVEAFGKNVRGDRRKYSYCEIWRDGEYDLYYINATSGKYEKNGVNLYNELSAEDKALIDAATSIEEKNRIFINHRITRAKSDDPVYGFKNHFNIDDAVFQIAILFILVASDNFEKNMYPYVIDKLMQFLQDDLDSIFPTDNQAQDTKRYSAELEDFTDETESAYVFKGEDSAFWQAMRLAYPERIQQMGRDILQAMYELSPIGSTTLEKLMGFFEEYYFGRAQEYFTKSMYNDDAEYAYEEAWNNKKYVSEVDIHPLAQSLGDHDAVERAFIEKRLVFLMSKFSFGSYSNYEDTSLGRISFRTQNPQGFTLTPAIDSYPAILGGASGAVKAQKRVMAGESVTLEGVGGGNTNVYIVGADWLSDIGDLKDLQIDPSSVVTLNVSSKRLRRIKVGDENAEAVTSHLATLSIQRCDSMESVDARNLVTLTGTVDLTQCPRLIQAMFGGTNVSSVLIAAGSKVEKIELPDSVTTIDLRNTKFLEDFSIGTLANVNFLRLESVPAINGFAMLRDVYNTEGQTLSNIRVIGWEYAGDANDLSMLADLANGKDDFGKRRYKGIDVDGKPTDGLPVLEGILSIDGGVYQDDVDEVQGAFGGITINYDPLKIYVKFADPEVQRICAENWGDGTGITTVQIEAVTDIGTKFRGNTTIEYFDEFEKFIGVKSVSDSFTSSAIKSIKMPDSITRFNIYYEHGTFGGCYSLQYIKLPKNLIQLNNRAFYGCASLKELILPQTISIIGYEAFRDCKANFDVNLPNLESLDYTAFKNSGVTKVVSLGRISEIKSRYEHGGFQNCVNLTSVVLSESIKKIGAYCFSGCTSLVDINFEHIEIFDTTSFSGTKFKELICPNLTQITQYSTYGNNFSTTEIETIDLGKIVNIPSAGNSDHSIFGNMPYLRKLVLPNTLKSIGNYAFKGNKGLSETNIPTSVTNIGTQAFYNCTSLEIEDLQLPNLETLAQNAFYGVKIKKISNLGKITKLPTASSSIQNFGDKSVLEEINIPYGVVNIVESCFQGYNKLNICTIPSSVTTIGYYSFNGCTSLAYIDVVNATSIIAGAFLNCTNLSVIVCQKVVSIGNSAFENTKIGGDFISESLTSLGEKNGAMIERLITPNLTSLGWGIFAAKTNIKLALVGEISSFSGENFSNASNFETLIIKNPTPPTLGNNVFVRTKIASGVGSIYVPDVSVATYRGASGWVTYASTIKPISQLQMDNPDLYEEIKEYLGSYVANLILLPNSKTTNTPTIELTTYYNGEIVTPEYSVDSDIAAVVDGVLTFTSKGEVTVTATYNGESVSATYSYIQMVYFADWEYNKAYGVGNYAVGSTWNENVLDTQYTTNWKCAIIPIDESVKSVTINGTGGTGARLYCMLDANNVVLKVASTGYTANDETIQIPTGCAKLIVNINPSSNNPYLILILNL